MDNSSKRILLVEDQVIIATDLAEFLTLQGYIVDFVTSAEAAISFCQNQQSPDLILMDINLGAGMDGAEAAKVILSERQIPVLFLSSHSELEIVEKTEKITSFGYVSKSSDHNILAASVKMAFKLYNAYKEKAISEETFRAKEEIYHRIFDCTPAFITLTDLSTGKYFEANQNFIDVCGYTRDEIIGKLASELGFITKESRNNIVLALKEGNGKVRGKEVTFLTKDNKPIPCLCNGEIIKIGEKSYIISAAQDISQQKKVETDLSKAIEQEKQLKKSVEETSLLLNELQHRIKNSLHLLNSLISLAISKTKEKQITEEFMVLEKRITSITSIYELLSETNKISSIDFKRYLSQLAEIVLEAWVPYYGDIKITQEICEMELDIKRAIPLGIIINELITNSMKYAFKDRQNGEIKMSLEKEENTIFFNFSDNGIGLPDNFQADEERQGIGYNLISGLVKQMKATLFINNKNGTTIRIEISDPSCISV